jgi:hypothetical protein
MHLRDPHKLDAWPPAVACGRTVDAKESTALALALARGTKVTCDDCVSVAGAAMRLQLRESGAIAPLTEIRAMQLEIESAAQASTKADVEAYERRLHEIMDVASIPRSSSDDAAWSVVRRLSWLACEHAEPAEKLTLLRRIATLLRLVGP